MNGAAAILAVLGLTIIVLVLASILGRIALQRSSQTSRAGADVDVDPSAPAAGKPAQASPARPTRVLAVPPDVAPTPVATTVYRGAGGRFAPAPKAADTADAHGHEADPADRGCCQ